MQGHFHFRYPIRVFNWVIILNLLFQMMGISFLGIAGIHFFINNEQLVFACSYFIVVFSIAVVLLFHRYDILKFFETRFGYSKDFLEIQEDCFVIPEMYFIKKSLSREKIRIPLACVSKIYYNDLTPELCVEFNYDFLPYSLVLKKEYFYSDPEEFKEIVNYFKFNIS